jgi:hypothetical protein
VDKASQLRIVGDAEGNLWSLPSTDNPWAERQPFSPAEETELEPVPGHYKGTCSAYRSSGENAP